MCNAVQTSITKKSSCTTTKGLFGAQVQFELS